MCCMPAECWLWWLLQRRQMSDYSSVSPPDWLLFYLLWPSKCNLQVLPLVKSACPQPENLGFDDGALCVVWKTLRDLAMDRVIGINSFILQLPMRRKCSMLTEPVAFGTFFVWGECVLQLFNKLTHLHIIHLYIFHRFPDAVPVLGTTFTGTIFTIVQVTKRVKSSITSYA